MKVIQSINLWVLILALMSNGWQAKAVSAVTDLEVYGDGLASGWNNWSFSAVINLNSQAQVHSGQSAVAITFSQGWDGFQLGRMSTIDVSMYNTLRFWIYGGSGGQTMEMSVSRGGTICQRVTRVIAASSSWQEVNIPLAELGQPAEASGLMWWNNTNNPQDTIYLDDIAFVYLPPSSAAPALPGPVLSVDANSGQHPISPLIYGMNFAEESLAAEIQLPVRRWGGNSTTRFNWENDTTNHASDWFFENIPETNPTPGLLPNGSSVDRFVDQDRRTGTLSLLTAPMIGWTPKSRGYSCGFSVTKYGAQDSVDSWRNDCGNGKSGGKNLTGNDPTDTSKAIGPSFVQNWIAHLQAVFGSAAQGGVSLYNLDNEPMLWNSTHRDVHPLPVSYDELKQRTIDYAAAIKAADPGAQTLGPVLWGWTAYFYSAKDIVEGTKWWDTRADRKAHGDMPLLPWYLQQMKAYQDQNGLRLLDYVDVHIYPQAGGVFTDWAGDATAQATRLRSTRSLWDPTYTDESWINEPIYLIPRLRQWVANYYPSTKTAITEYSWGAQCHISGALAQADILGIFGREQLDLATLWAPPSSVQPGAFAFRMFRNYDGLGGQFGDQSVTAQSANSDKLSIFAARRSSDSALTVVMINKTTTDLTSTVRLNNFWGAPAARAYRYSISHLDAIQSLPDQALNGDGTSSTFPAHSITLWVIPAGINLYLPEVTR